MWCSSVEGLIISPEPSAAAEVRAAHLARFRLTSPAHLIALGFGSGLFPRAPGTVGTLWAWCVFVALEDWVLVHEWLVVIAVAFLVGVWACGRAARDVGVADHSAIVWDEVVAFWLVLAFLPTDWLSQLAAFAVFRFFDIVKPPPIGYFDARLKGGFGIMFDDALAAFFTLLVFAIVRSVGL
ncbi:MAG: phosphatidylglycerophosphatase A [Betaproteobacteria bacterium]|nr:phosphatidylglycerophosphatase A [Betaproteobacteria bacterium]